MKAGLKKVQSNYVLMYLNNELMAYVFNSTEKMVTANVNSCMLKYTSSYCLAVVPKGLYCNTNSKVSRNR